MQDAAGGVVGVVEDQKPGLFCAGALQNVTGDPVVGLVIQLYLDGDSACGLDDGLIGDPGRIQDDALLSGIQRGAYCQEDGVFTAGGQENAGLVTVDVVIPLELSGDGVAQLRNTGTHHIVGVSLGQAPNGRHGDPVGCCKIRLAASQADDRGVLLLHFLCTTHEYHGCRGLHIFNTVIHSVETSLIPQAFQAAF